LQLKRILQHTLKYLFLTLLLKQK